jgi:hypothetical protein
MPECCKKMLIGFLIAIVFCSCASVKPYQRAYLNDVEMQTGAEAPAQFEIYFESIREGSTPAEGGKTTDGCGCK